MAETKPKAYYSCLDMTCIRIAPQAVQHLVIGQFVEKLGGKVTFYTAENTHTRESHEVILAKVEERPAVDGLIYYRLNQFLSPTNGPALEVMNAILIAGYELHFAVDKVSLLKPADLDAFFPMLSATAHAERDELDRAGFQALLHPALPPLAD